MKQKVLPLLVFQTDFTYLEGAVASMYGVVRSVDMNTEIITATHELPQYDIWSASYRLQQYAGFWPKGTVFVSVVDPGVGTSRKACAAYTKDGYYIITPDNGTLTHVQREHGIEEIREIDETRNRLPSTRGTSVFHGRDLFGYCAAKLAAGKITFEETGKPYSTDEIVTLPVETAVLNNGVIRGIIEIDDPNFGNLWTNIPLEDFTKAGFHYGDMVHTRILYEDRVVFEKDVLFHQSFGFAKKGDPMLYNNELMKVAMAVTQGSLVHEYGLSYGSSWKVDFSKA
jgi:S-adenosylmethionine hydrolase